MAFAFYTSLSNFALLKMVDVVQLVRMLDCDSGGRGFEPRHSPLINKSLNSEAFCLKQVH